MGSEAINAPLKVGRRRSAVVWFGDNAALSEGEAVCYNWDYNRSGGAATAAYPERRNLVETPSTTNAQFFAGVAARDYPAKSGGRLIEINLPGSVCNVLVGASTTIGVGFLTFDVTAATVGQFRRMGLPGRGSARPMQTVTYSATALKCLCHLMDGEESGGCEDVQLVDQTAFVAMVGGTTCCIGATLTNGDAAEEIPDGTIEGLKKKFEIVDTQCGTNNCKIDIANDDGRQSDGSYDLASVSLDAVGDQVVLQWTGGCWTILGGTGMEEA
jgi:hypothetical protein